MQGDVLLDGGDEFRTTLQAIGGEASDEALDYVQPRGRSEGEVDMEARALTSHA